MRAWIAKITCCATMVLALGACGNNKSLYATFSSSANRYDEEQLALSEDDFINEQYEDLFRGDMDIVVNKKIDLCDYRKLLYVRSSSHSTWLPDAVRNSVMRNFLDDNHFFRVIKTSAPVVYINAIPYKGTSIHQDDVMWYSENDPITIAWLKRFTQEQYYIIADAILNETNIDAGLLRQYAFELRLLDSEDGTVIVSFVNRRASLNKRPEAIIENTTERINGWLTRVGDLCDARPEPQPVQPPDNCVYDK